MICSHYLMDAHTFYYQAIVHQKKQVVPGRRSQLFQQDLTRRMEQEFPYQEKPKCL
uniref:Uncharacterized protein n=1 Tax=Rhizophora mucronata TaxID=61149 RepID=A0A2P2K0M2_RHIMU